MRPKYLLVIAVLVVVGLLLNGPAFSETRGVGVTIPAAAGGALELYTGSYALVLGNSSYANGLDPLPGVRQDVRDVARALEKNGFEVTAKTDLTKAQFQRAVTEFVLKYGRNPDNRLLFYYAGHGYTEPGATNEKFGYLIMVDAPNPTEDEIGFKLASLDMQYFVTQSKLITSKHVLFLFDSCFSGSILNFRASVKPKAISDAVRYPVRQFITAGRAEEPVPDRSVFKQAFVNILEGRAIEPMPDGYLTGEELGLYLKTIVPQYSPNQHPQYGKIRDMQLDKGDFVFVIDPEGRRAAAEAARRQKDKEAQQKQAAERQALKEEQRRLAEQQKQLLAMQAEIEKLKLERERTALEQEKALLEEKKELARQRRELAQLKTGSDAAPPAVSDPDKPWQGIWELTVDHPSGAGFNQKIQLVQEGDKIHSKEKIRKIGKIKGRVEGNQVAGLTSNYDRLAFTLLSDGDRFNGTVTYMGFGDHAVIKGRRVR